MLGHDRKGGGGEAVTRVMPPLPPNGGSGNAKALTIGALYHPPKIKEILCPHPKNK